MNNLRIILFSILSIASGIVSFYNFNIINDHVIEIPSVINIYSAYTVCLISIYIVLYTVKEQFKLNWKIGEINKTIFIIALLISPTLSIGTIIKANNIIHNYVECKDLREISSRYSSRTYAKSIELCQREK